MKEIYPSYRVSFGFFSFSLIILCFYIPYTEITYISKPEDFYLWFAMGSRRKGMLSDPRSHFQRIFFKVAWRVWSLIIEEAVGLGGGQSRYHYEKIICNVLQKCKGLWQYRLQGNPRPISLMECPRGRSRDGTANCLNTEMPAILMRKVIDGREQSQCSSCRAINHSDMNLRVHSPKLTEKGNRWDPFCIKDVESDANNQLVKTAIK